MKTAKRALMREPAWESFVRAGLMVEEDVARLTKIADVSRALAQRGERARSAEDERENDDERETYDAVETMRATIKYHGDAVCETLLGTLKNVGAVDATEHVLALLDVVMFQRAWDANARESDDGGGMFANYKGTSAEEALGEDAFFVVARTLERPEDASSWFIKEKASRALAAMVRARPKRASAGKETSVNNAIRTLTRWAVRELRSGDREKNERLIPAVIGTLASVLEIPEARELAASEGAVELLTPLLHTSSSRGVQTVYEVALCFWLMSFNTTARRAMCARGAMSVKALMACAASATKEKVIRVSILALKNITDRHGVGGDAVGDNFTAVDESLRKVVSNLSLRGFEDEELKSTLAELDEDLRARRKEASTWERYRSEVMSGSLEWSAAHKDEGFWRECATKLTDNNCQVLRVLIKLVDGSETMDSKTLAVAIHDIGEFAVHYPAGRFLANDLGGKEHAMRLMSHEDDEVRKYALMCVQKLLVSSWKSLS